MSAKSMACPYGVVCVYLRRSLPNIVLRDKNQRKSNTSSYVEYMKTLATAEMRKLRASRDGRINATEEMRRVKQHDTPQNTMPHRFSPMRTDDKRANLFQGVVAQEYFFWLNL